ncbi:MAG TPA: hypothetical protein DD490_09095, partial [Acidobacteria bacterium]|nr:hypothetical protein [Acidobacteriota bacterium]
MSTTAATLPPFPTPLDAYPPVPGGLLETLGERIAVNPFNAVATAIFVLAILHTFSAAWFAKLSHNVQHRADHRAAALGRPSRPSVLAELLHFLGEIEVVFGLWAIPLLIVMVLWVGWSTATHYLNDTVIYTEPLFVVVIMAIASTRPVIVFAERALQRLANLGKGTPGAWWFVILTIGPLFGSFITEPAARRSAQMVIAAGSVMN